MTHLSCDRSGASHLSFCHVENQAGGRTSGIFVQYVEGKVVIYFYVWCIWQGIFGGN